MSRRAARSKASTPKPKPEAEGQENETATTTDEVGTAAGPDTGQSAAPEVEGRDAEPNDNEGVPAKGPEASSEIKSTDGEALEARETSAAEDQDGTAANPDAEQSAAREVEDQGAKPNDNEGDPAKGPERREHVALCHVRHNGAMLPPGHPLQLTEKEFGELKRAKAVEGEW
jgi:hypothetical protein